MRSPSALTAATLLLSIGFAGCADDPPEATPSGSASVSPSSTAGSGEGGRAGTSDGPTELVLYLTGQHTLSLAKPATSKKVPETLSFFDVQGQTGEIPIPTWPFETLRSGWRITSMKAEVFVSSDGPQVNPLGPAFPDPFVFWMGETDANGPSQGMAGPMTINPGQIIKFEKTLLTPPAGLVYPIGATPTVRLGYFYSPSAANPLFIMTGGEDASALRITVEPYVSPALGSSKQKDESGSFTGAASGGGSAPDSTQTSRLIPFEVPSVDARIEAVLVGTSQAGRTDLDLVLVDPSGTDVWGSTGPDAKETLRVYEVNLREKGLGTYQFRIGNFQSTQATYTLKITTASVDVAPAAA